MAGKFSQGRLQNWFWVDTDNNPADWATKPRTVAELSESGFWQKGPKFLREDFDTWPIRSDFRTDRLEGEIMPKNAHLVLHVTEDLSSVMFRLLEDVSQVRKLFNIVAYVIKWRSLVDNNIARAVPGFVTAEEVSKARDFWIRLVQQTWEEELVSSVSKEDDGKVRGRFKRLSVYKDEKDIWRVGLRIREYAPFTCNHKPPAFLPRHSRLTFLLMEQAHRKKHSGVSETVAQFRMMGYWAPHAQKLAKSIQNSCVTCRLLDKRPEHQLMGSIPEEQLTNVMA